ncbi:hypothetical protein BCR37DRAFT_376883 [Protomyces lactucae-debilis]|uniref:DUF5745 domain-containing protein n=1 Tax=Protomyces lactucae-debilis TaxID=2754530 RepID=A0A1Y2FQU8_PROLT|nr:uncharacterized protein BCR37DRAFT_376883 [Protomyces lactucae-debilis]ORY86309.1 hypothetical protein BCR37DRAFT_376883 [Protomyces lactucae-debilis]
MRSPRHTLLELNALLLKHKLPRVKRFAEISPLLLIALYECMQGERLALQQRANATKSQQVQQIVCLVDVISKTIFKLDPALISAEQVVERQEVALCQLIHILLIVDQVLELPEALQKVVEDAEASTIMSDWVSDQGAQKPPTPRVATKQRRKRSAQASRVRAPRATTGSPRASAIDIGDLYHMLKIHYSPGAHTRPESQSVPQASPVVSIHTPDFMLRRKADLKPSLHRHVYSPQARVILTPRQRQPISPRYNRFKRSLGSVRGPRNHLFATPQRHFQSLRQSIRSTAGDSDAVFYQDDTIM